MRIGATHIAGHSTTTTTTPITPASTIVHATRHHDQPPRSIHGAVNATTGLLSYWRLGEAAQSVTVADAFTGASGTALAAHTSASGTTWAHLSGTADAVLTDANRVRRGTPAFLQAPYSVDYATTAPSSADYSVSATLVVKSTLSGDMVGVIGLNWPVETMRESWQAAKDVRFGEAPEPPPPDAG